MMRRMTSARPASLPAIVGVMLVAGSAAAAPSDDDRARADTLFRDAKALMAAQNFVDACPKLAQSEALDPQLGTLLNLALCHESSGKIASAWTEYNEAASLAERTHQAERATFARGHASAIEGKLARLRIVAVPEVAATPGMTVSIDGTIVAQSAWGAAIPFDPGEHAIDQTAIGKKSISQNVHLSAGAGTTDVNLLAMVDQSVASPAPPPTAAKLPAAGNHDDGATMRTLGFVGLGLGAVGLGLGSVFGIETFAYKSDANSLCDPSNCRGAGNHDRDIAHRDATISTVSFAAGIAAAGAGLYLVIAAPASAKATDSASADASWWIAPRLGGFAAGHRW